MDLSDKKAIKKILKRFKKHPDWYTQAEVIYAKLMKKQLKKKEKSDE